jgi:hypothetical protein
VTCTWLGGTPTRARASPATVVARTSGHAFHDIAAFVTGGRPDLQNRPTATDPSDRRSAQRDAHPDVVAAALADA